MEPGEASDDVAADYCDVVASVYTGTCACACGLVAGGLVSAVDVDC